MSAGENKAEQRPAAKRHIRNFLLDKGFQLGWVVRVALVTAVIVGVMGYFLYGTLSESSELVVTQALSAEGMAPEAQAAFIEQGERDKASTLIILVGGLVGLVVLLSLLTIVATHKIAGPAYKMRRLFSEIDGDHLQLWAKLRKGDELHDVFQGFDDMVRRLRESRREDVDLLKSIDPSSLSEEGRKALSGIVSRYEDSVRMD